MQHYVIKFVNDLRNVCVGSPGTTVSSRSKTAHCNIAEILLKVALNTITLAQLDNRRNEYKRLETFIMNISVKQLRS
jgi:hypothetical protein